MRVPQMRMPRALASDRRGFSLVELLVAMTILGVIVAPLLHTFVTASHTTVRSRRIGDATLAAQNIAETLETQQVDATLPAQLKNRLDTTAAGFYSLSDGAYAPGSYDSTSKVHYVGLTGIPGGESTFDALVTLDAADYSDGSTGFNDLELTDYSNMDAIFAQSREDGEDPDKIAAHNYRNDVAAYNYAACSEPLTIDRTIDLRVGWVVEEGGAVSTSKITATLSFSYRYTYFYKDRLLNDDGSEAAWQTGSWTDQDHPATVKLLFPTGFGVAGGAVPSIYLLYYPMYDTATVNVKDTINIYNQNDLDFKLFLGKQLDPTITHDALSAGEMGYQAEIRQWQTRLSDPVAQVYSNAKENLVSGQNISGVTYKRVRGIYGSTPTYSFAGTEGELVSRTARNRIYTVTVSLYAPGQSYSETPLYTFTTTKLQ